jgi:hypothetical protein
LRDTGSRAVIEALQGKVAAIDDGLTRIEGAEGLIVR